LNIKQGGYLNEKKRYEEREREREMLVITNSPAAEKKSQDSHPYTIGRELKLKGSANRS
jgi:hypothetical protein